MSDPLNALEREDVRVQLDRLAAAYGRKKLDPDSIDVWRDRLRQASVKPPELKRAADWVMDRVERFPSLSVMLDAVYRERGDSAGAGAEARRQGVIERPEEYEAWRQATKQRLGLSGHRSAEHLRRYGPEIPVTDPYVPPSLRQAMAEDPEGAPRGNGPRRMF